jgi:hypothetical protein
MIGRRSASAFNAFLAIIPDTGIGKESYEVRGVMKGFEVWYERTRGHNPETCMVANKGEADARVSLV